METPNTPETQPEPKTWTTPSFEKMALKDALTGTGKFDVLDGVSYYS